MPVSETYRLRQVIGTGDVLKDGRFFTDSLKVAKVFGKRHSSVLQAIDNRKCDEDYFINNIIPCKYVNKQGKEQPMYLITLVGLMLIAFSKHTKAKITYIKAFNEAVGIIKDGQLEYSKWQARVQEKKIEFAMLRSKISALELDNFLSSNGSVMDHKKIKKLRYYLGKGLSQKDIAKLLDISSFSVRKYEKLSRHVGLLKVHGKTQKIRCYRDKQLNQSEIARLLEVSATTIHDYEKLTENTSIMEVS